MKVRSIAGKPVEADIPVEDLVFFPACRSTSRPNKSSTVPRIFPRSSSFSSSYQFRREISDVVCINFRFFKAGLEIYPDEQSRRDLSKSLNDAGRSCGYCCMIVESLIHFRSIPFQIHSIPFHSIPLSIHGIRNVVHSSPFRIHSIPLSLPLPFHSIPFHSIPPLSGFSSPWAGPIPALILRSIPMGCSDPFHLGENHSTRASRSFPSYLLGIPAMHPICSMLPEIRGSEFSAEIGFYAR